jgi:hypothetical protein
MGTPFVPFKSPGSGFKEPRATLTLCRSDRSSVPLEAMMLRLQSLKSVLVVTALAASVVGAASTNPAAAGVGSLGLRGGETSDFSRRESSQVCFHRLSEWFGGGVGGG